MLKNFRGSILSDGFSGYNRFKKMPGIIVGNCWVHARREFYDIRQNYPYETMKILDLIDELFAIERRAKTWTELTILRGTESTAASNRIRFWLFEERQKHFPSSGLVKTIDYCLGRWKELTAFLTCPALPLTNNDAERALRHCVLGRKNFAGSKTINGADTAATLYTVIDSAKKAGLQPKQYLKYLVEERWNKRLPLSPLRYSWQLYGKPKNARQ
jgi:transposase